MMTPHRIPKAITLFGLATTITGLAFKLNHLMSATVVFNVGILILVIGLTFWAVRLIKN